jgi:putative PIN family toxin of toxin-antitoxin system
MKVVLDTNVLFAAVVAKRGICAGVVEHVLEREQLVLCEPILAELSEHLVDKARLSSPLVAALAERLRREAWIVTPASVDANACRDAKDLPILGACLSAHAEALVSGDKDLLSLKAFNQTRILSPREFHDRFVFP